MRNPAERTRRLLALSTRMRAAVGPAYRLGAIIPSPVGMKRLRHYWPGFPYAGLARQYDAFVPMAYYSSRTHNAAEVARYALRSIAIIRAESGRPGLPIHIIGGMASATSTSEAAAFVRTIVSCGVAGFSLYDYSGTNPALWRLLAEPGACRRGRSGLLAACASASSCPRSSARCAGRSFARSRWPPSAAASTRSGSATTCSTAATAAPSAGRGTCGRRSRPWRRRPSACGSGRSSPRLAFHPPGLVARMAASIDEVSQGRFTLGVGAGWNETEFRAFGIPFDNRVARFEEAFEIVRRLLAGERVSVRRALPPGRGRRAPAAAGAPRPAHGRDDRAARLFAAAAPHVDWWNMWYSQYGNTPSGYRRAQLARSTATSSAARACSWPSTAGRRAAAGRGAARRVAALPRPSATSSGRPAPTRRSSSSIRSPSARSAPSQTRFSSAAEAPPRRTRARPRRRDTPGWIPVRG